MLWYLRETNNDLLQMCYLWGWSEIINTTKTQRTPSNPLLVTLCNAAYLLFAPACAERNVVKKRQQDCNVSKK